MNIKSSFKDIRSYIDKLEKEINNIPEKVNVDIHQLINLLNEIDEQYEESCKEGDKDCGEEIGTIYNGEYGENLEFYIEASHWHEVSLFLRKMKIELKLKDINENN